MAENLLSLQEMMQGCFAPRTVTAFVNAMSVDCWQRETGRLETNRFQEVALLHLYEGMHTLILRRDEVDDIRDSIWAANGGSHTPTAQQQKQFNRVATSYFDEYYSALSKLSGVVARFQQVFLKNFTENAPFIAWLVERYQLPPSLEETLSEARQFRAILAHPQQFPAHEWGTTADMTTGGLLRLMLWGPFGRGKNAVPRGALSNDESAQILGPGWHFVAPDEVSVTNVLAVVVELVLAEIVSWYSGRSAFSRPISLEEAAVKLHPDGLDVSEEARRVPSEFDHPEMPPATTVRPWVSDAR